MTPFAVLVALRFSRDQLILMEQQMADARRKRDTMALIALQAQAAKMCIDADTTTLMEIVNQVQQQLEQAEAARLAGATSMEVTFDIRSEVSLA